jgi:drug/metabolite transporter (DMT)-like permease
MSALTALGFGILIPSIDRLAPALGRLGAVSAVLLVDLVLWVPLAAVVRLDIRPPSWRAWPLVLAAGAFETTGFVWISLGIARAPVAVVSPFAGLSSAFTVLYAWIALGERPARPVVAGAALVCGGVVLLSL